MAMVLQRLNRVCVCLAEVCPSVQIVKPFLDVWIFALLMTSCCSPRSSLPRRAPAPYVVVVSLSSLDFVKLLFEKRSILARNLLVLLVSVRSYLSDLSSVTVIQQAYLAPDCDCNQNSYRSGNERPKQAGQQRTSSHIGRHSGCNYRRVCLRRCRR